LGAGAIAVGPSLSFATLLPSLVLFGAGIGFAGSQLNNVILAEVPVHRSGAASGANTTVRMIGSSLGIAVISSLLTTQTIHHAVNEVDAAASLPKLVRTHAISQIHTSGINFAPRRGTSALNTATLREAIDHAVVSGARVPLIFAAVVLVFASALSFFIPQVGPRGSLQGGTGAHEPDPEAQESELIAETAQTQ
jgi:hypothetical protein